MADVKITALPAATSVAPSADVLPLVTGGGATTSKATPTQIVTAALDATAVTVDQGGTGAVTLTGYVKGSGQGQSFDALTFCSVSHRLTNVALPPTVPRTCAKKSLLRVSPESYWKIVIVTAVCGGT